MIKKLLFAIALFLNSTLIWAEPGIEIPLTYHPYSGAYTMSFWVGCPAQQQDAVVDTGSANVNILGDKKLCPSCTSELLNPTFYHLSACSKPFTASFEMAYGSDAGTVQVYEDELRLAPNEKPLPFDFSVYIHGKNVNNVVGLAYDTIAAPQDYPLLPFFPAIRESYKLDNIFSLKFCDERGKSALNLGSSLISEKQVGWQYTPIAKKDFYNVLLESINDKATQKPIVSFGERQLDQLAILDSGTMGVLIFPNDETDIIKQYLQHYYQSKTQQPLPKEFWMQNACVLTNTINLNAFPTLQFKFAKWNHPGQAITLDLPAKRYLNRGGCGDGYVRLAFISQHIYEKHVTANFKDHKKFTPLARSTKILGTPLFENYVVTIHQGEVYSTDAKNNSYIGFYPSASLCK